MCPRLTCRRLSAVFRGHFAIGCRAVFLVSTSGSPSSPRPSSAGSHRRRFLLPSFGSDPNPSLATRVDIPTFKPSQAKQSIFPGASWVRRTPPDVDVAAPLATLYSSPSHWACCASVSACRWFCARGKRTPARRSAFRQEPERGRICRLQCAQPAAARRGLRRGCGRRRHAGWTMWCTLTARSSRFGRNAPTTHTARARCADSTRALEQKPSRNSQTEPKNASCVRTRTAGLGCTTRYSRYDRGTFPRCTQPRRRGRPRARREAVPVRAAL